MCRKFTNLCVSNFIFNKVFFSFSGKTICTKVLRIHQLSTLVLQPQVHLKVVGVLATLRGHWTKNCYRLLENGDFNHDSSSHYTARMCQEIAMDRSKDCTSQV